MRWLFCCAVVSAIAVLPSHAEEQKRLVITKNWYHLDGKDLEDFTIYRKFTVDTSANMPPRNLLQLYCSKNDKTSHLTVFVPYKFDLPEIYGQQKIEKKRYAFFVTDRNGRTYNFNLYAEVDQNQLYFDYNSEQQDKFEKLLTAHQVSLYLHDQNIPMQWLQIDDVRTWPSIGDNKIKLDFDTWTNEILHRVGFKTSVLTTKELYHVCPEIGAAN